MEKNWWFPGFRDAEEDNSSKGVAGEESCGPGMVLYVECIGVIK